VTDVFYGQAHPDTVYCIGRAMALAILVSSAALLSRQRRVGFERHLILFITAGFLLAAELFGVVAGVMWGAQSALNAPGLWVWYPVLSTVGLLGLMLWFDYVRSSFVGSALGQGGRRVRANSRLYLMAAAFVFALGARLSSVHFPAIGPPSSFFHMRKAAYALHGVRTAAMLVICWKAYAMFGNWFSRSESRAFTIGCVAALFGAAGQFWYGPREHFTTLAYTVFVAVFLRDNYRRSEIDAVQASEDRSAKTLLFHRITTQLKSTFELSRLCELLMDSLVSNLGAESGAIYIREESDSCLRPALFYGDYPPPMRLPEDLPDNAAAVRRLLEQTPVPMGEGIVGAVARNGAPDYVYDAADAARHYAWPTGAVRVHTAIALPLRSPGGSLGVVHVVNRIGGAPFGEDDLRFISLIVEQAGLAIYNARLHRKIVERQRTEQQIQIARQIQLRLIPSDLPNIPGVAIGAEYRAAQEVGGDYYDFYRIDHDHLGVLIFDVSGKGVPGAMLMAITRTFLKMAAPRSNSPAWALNEVNAALTAELQRGLFVTATYAVLKLSALELTLCCAGHTDTLIVRDRDRSCERHKPKGAALGLLRPNKFRALLEQETVQLAPGDTLLLYTDGVIEAMNEKGEEFGQARLCEIASRTAGKGPERLIENICEAVDEHARSSPQYDDITALAIRVGVDAPAPQDAPEAP